jgi:MFS family permease
MNTIVETKARELFVVPESTIPVTLTNPALAAERQKRSLRWNRIAVGMVFFLHGLCFASWASRIPTIQANLQLSASALGAVLFALPAGFFVSLPFAGWLVGRLGSKRVVIVAATLYSLALVCVGASPTVPALACCLFCFGFFANLLNISINTQAVVVERLYQRKLMATFHGLWSLAGFAGAAIGAWMMAHAVPPAHHYILICVIFLLVISTCAFYLVAQDDVAGEKLPLFALPDRALISLGLIAFCSMIAEGAMFDWSGVYFNQVVHVDAAYTGLGYTTFMIAMAGMRFVADRLSGRFGLKRILQVSGLLTTIGLLVAVIFPSLLPSLAGFFLIGMGVSSVVPLVFSAAGQSKTLTPGVAIAAVSSLGFMGMLIGPPVIGFIADATSLRMSFLSLIVLSVSVVILSSLIARSRADAE